ncbi:MAG: hypothetical protein HN377_12135, partial [Alphaproteobacteria bacterium]|nr:hypothetical protein [Alphaproteobacteria bacterium]
VRTDVAGALSALADPRAATQLMENLLGDPCTDVKLAAIDALVRLKETDVVPWLRKLIRGRDEDIAWDDSEFFENGWDDWVDVQVKAIEGLAELGIAEAIPDIIEAMEDENAQELSGFVFKALARLGDPGAEALSLFLCDSDERRRRRAVAALAGAKGEKIESLLSEALSDTAAMVRLAALQALAERDPSGINLASVFEDESPEVRAEAVRLIGAAHPGHLQHLVDDESADVQKAVMGILIEQPELGDSDTLTAILRSKLDDPDPQLVSIAAMTSAEVSPQGSFDDLVALLADTNRPVEVRVGALRGLSRINNEKAIQAIIGVIVDKERPLRVEAMAALATAARADMAWPNSAAETLLQALRGELSDPDEDAAVIPKKSKRQQAEPSKPKADELDDAFPTSTLSAIMADHPAVAKVVDLPEEGIELTPMDMERLALAQRIKGKKSLPVVPVVAPHQDIRRFAARVLGDLSHDAVAEALAQALSDGDKDVRRAVADSLARFAGQTGSLPEPAIDALLANVNDSDRDLRLLVVRALGLSLEKRAAGVLKGCLGDIDSFVRTEAIRALFGLGEAALEIEALLGDSDSGVRLAAAEVVAASDGDGAVESLVDFAFGFEGYHRREAGRLLRGLDADLASASFMEVLSDDARTRTWPVAIEALEELNCLADGKNEPAVATAT